MAVQGAVGTGESQRYGVQALLQLLHRQYDMLLLVGDGALLAVDDTSSGERALEVENHVGKLAEQEGNDGGARDDLLLAGGDVEREVTWLMMRLRSAASSLVTPAFSDCVVCDAWGVAFRCVVLVLLRCAVLPMTVRQSRKVNSLNLIFMV